MEVVVVMADASDDDGTALAGHSRRLDTAQDVAAFP